MLRTQPRLPEVESELGSVAPSRGSWGRRAKSRSSCWDVGEGDRTYFQVRVREGKVREHSTLVR